MKKSNLTEGKIKKGGMNSSYQIKERPAPPSPQRLKPSEQIKKETSESSPSDLSSIINCRVIDDGYFKRLLDVGRHAKKIPWSCSMYHQIAVARVLRNEGITDEMTMEETLNFETTEEPPVLLDTDGNKCSIQRAMESLQLCKLNIERLQKQIHRYRLWEKKQAQQKPYEPQLPTNQKNG
jgi:hypothetical protein